MWSNDAWNPNTRFEPFESLSGTCNRVGAQTWKNPMSQETRSSAFLHISCEDFSFAVVSHSSQMSNLKQHQGTTTGNGVEWLRQITPREGSRKKEKLEQGNQGKRKICQLQSHGVDIVDVIGAWQGRLGNKRIQTSRK